MSYAQQQPVDHQPMATQGMNVMSGGNRLNTKNLPIDADGREWSNGLCGCCGDAGTCILACCCACIVYGKNKHRLEHLTQKGYPDPEHGGCCSGDCVVHGLLHHFGFSWILQMGNRGATRSRYSIKGGGCGDCCTSFCCGPCALTQESQEIELEENNFRASGKA